MMLNMRPPEIELWLVWDHGCKTPRLHEGRRGEGARAESATLSSMRLGYPPAGPTRLGFMRGAAGGANAVRLAERRISETLVFPVPAVASAGRDVVVTHDSADRPVHARTFSGAPVKCFHVPAVCVCTGDVKAGCMLRRKLARDSVLSIETIPRNMEHFSRDSPRSLTLTTHVIPQSRDERASPLSPTQPR
jgi:hypothetical protein